MDTLVSKSTFYDTVSMIVPGFITLFSLANIFNLGLSYFTDKTLAVPYYICIFALSYLVGLLIHRFSQCCFDWWLRNNPKHIQIAEEKFNGDVNDRGIESVLDKRKKFVKYLKSMCIKRVCQPKWKKGKSDAETYNMDNYYIKYYQVIDRSSSIPVMEAQVSFIRSMLIVIPLGCLALLSALCRNYSVSSYFATLSLCEKFCFIISIIFSIVIIKLFYISLINLMYYIQSKIYYRVFEDSYYTNKIKEKEQKRIKLIRIINNQINNNDL